MLDLAKCTIISHSTNNYFDAFVLSESSLFVYPYKVMIKTCGTTTLLKTVPKLLEYASRFSLEVELVLFSRKNFLFPDKQIYPHTDWRDEIRYLDEYFVGQSYIFGPRSADHWYLYLADYSDASALSSKDVTLEIMMHNLEEKNAQNKFCRKEGTGDFDKLPGN